MTRAWNRRAAFLLPLALAGCASDLIEPPPVPARKLDAVTLDTDEALRWLNAYRAKQGLGPVTLDPRLMDLAQAQADAMASADKVSHDVIGAFADRFAASGARSSEAGENVCVLGDALRRGAGKEPAQRLGRFLGDGHSLARRCFKGPRRPLWPLS